jgi:hypothetical protein
MGLAGASTEDLTRTKSELDNYLGNKELLDQVEAILASSSSNELTEDNTKTLKILQKTLRCYIITDPSVLQLRDKLGVLEAALQQRRNNFALGYTDPATQTFVKASSVLLRTTMYVMSMSYHVIFSILPAPYILIAPAAERSRMKQNGAERSRTEQNGAVEWSRIEQNGWMEQNGAEWSRMEQNEAESQLLLLILLHSSCSIHIVCTSSKKEQNRAEGIRKEQNGAE